MTGTASEDWPRRVAILGVGLLGGSVSLSLRRKRPDAIFVGYSRTVSKLEYARTGGIINVATDSVSQACKDCDVVVIATPVDRIAPMVMEASAASPTECLITDVGSTKAQIVADVGKHGGAAKKFVAAHPIAGSEKKGAEHALATLFDDKLVLLTPDQCTPKSQLAKAERFWQMTGGLTRTMNPLAHDAHLAAVSHVPHLLSALVAKMIDDETRSLVGSGWQDITRVAGGDPEMWTAICQENRTAIASELTRVAHQLDALRQIIVDKDDDRLRRWLAEAKRAKETTL